MDDSANEDEAKLLKMPRLRLAKGQDLPLGIGLVYALTPLVVAVVVLAATSAPWSEVAALAAWHAWCAQVALTPRPLNTVAGAMVSAVTLVGGVATAQCVGHPLIRTQYVMATIMFVWGRGNVLANDTHLRAMPVGFRLAYVFSFLDLGASRFYATQAARDRGLAALLRRSMWSAGTSAVTSALLAALATDIVRDLGRASLATTVAVETLRVAAGGANFCAGIYLGDAIYQVPLFLFARDAPSTLQPRPLMIAPWRSGTVKEWWGARFDTGMQSVLFGNAYRPARLLGLSRAAAVCATFALSGAIHCPLIYELGAEQADLVLMFAFFVAQAVLVLAETYLTLAPSRLRTLGSLFASSPLFVYPVLARMGLCGQPCL